MAQLVYGIVTCLFFCFFNYPRILYTPSIHSPLPPKDFALRVTRRFPAHGEFHSWLGLHQAQRRAAWAAISEGVSLRQGPSGCHSAGSSTINDAPRFQTFGVLETTPIQKQTLL